MKEKSHRAAQGCYRSGSETFLRPNARRLDGYSLYTDKPEFEQLAHPSIYQAINLALRLRSGSPAAPEMLARTSDGPAAL